jgi:hypothetical protein
MRREGVSLSAESASRGRKGIDTHGGRDGRDRNENNNNNTSQSTTTSISTGNAHIGNPVSADARSRLARRQTRCSHNRGRQALETLRRRVEVLDKSSKAMLAKSRPTNEDLRRFIEQEFEPKDKQALAARFIVRLFFLYCVL